MIILVSIVADVRYFLESRSLEDSSSLNVEYVALHIHTDYRVGQLAEY